LFDVVGRRCALRASRVRAALPLPRLSRPPEAPPALAGLLDLAGEILPVVRMAALFGEAVAPGEDPLDAHIVVLRGAGHKGDLGLLVERAVDVTECPLDAVQAMDPARSFNGLVAGEVTVQGSLVHLLDADRLLLAEEKLALDSFAQRAGERVAQWAGPASRAPS
jgi:purine-binding chemotaxis protein CheW